MKKKVPAQYWGIEKERKWEEKKKRVRDTGIESDDHVPSTEIPTHVK